MTACYRAAAFAFTSPAPVKKLIGIFGKIRNLPELVDPLSNVTVTFVPSNRSGSTWVNPSTGSNTLMPKSLDSFGPKVPGLNVSIIVVSVRENVTSPALSPLTDPMWKRPGAADVTSPGADRSKVTDLIVRKENGSTS